MKVRLAVLAEEPEVTILEIDLADMVTLVDWDNPYKAYTQAVSLSSKSDETSFLFPLKESFQDGGFYLRDREARFTEMGMDYFVDLRGNKRSVPKRPTKPISGGFYTVFMLHATIKSSLFYGGIGSDKIYLENPETAMTLDELRTDSGLKDFRFELGKNLKGDSAVYKEIEKALDNGHLFIFHAIQEEKIKRLLDGNLSLRKKVFGY